MHRIALILLSMMLIVAPVAAQQATPAPSGQTLVGEVVDATQTLGILTVVILAVLGILAAVVLIVVLIAWRGLSPLLGTIKSLNTAREDLQAQLFERLESGDKERARTAEINERTVSRLGEIETRTEAQQSRQTAVEEINTHTDEAVKPIVRASDDTLSELRELREQFKTLITKKQFDGAMTGMTDRLDKIITEMERKQAPCPPDPAPAESALAEHGTVEPADESKEG